MTTDTPDDPFNIDTDIELDDTVTACPECDEPGIVTVNTDRNYRCIECGHEFDDPVKREPKKYGKDLPRLLRERAGGDAA